MLPTLVRIVARSPGKVVRNSRIAKPATRKRLVDSYGSKWRSRGMKTTREPEKMTLEEAGAFQGTNHSINFDELTESITKDLPSEKDLEEFAQNYTAHSKDKLTAPPPVSDDAETIRFNARLKILYARHEYERIFSEFSDIEKRQTVPDCETIQYVVEAIAETKKFHLFQPIDEFMTAIRILKTLPLHNAILRLCAESGNARRASLAFKEMLTQSRLTPDIRSVEYYMLAHASVPEHFQIVMEAFTAYPKKWNLKPDSDFEGAFIRALLMNGREEVAMRRWSAVLSGALPSPSNKTIQAMLAYFCSKQQYDRVDTLFSDINARFGLFPDKDNCATYLESKMAQGKSKEAVKIVERLCAEGWPVDKNMVTKLMEEMLKNDERTSIERLWAMCPAGKISPDSKILEILVSACCKEGLPDRAMAFMVLGQEKFNIPLTRSMYAYVISEYGAKQQLDKCITLYRRMALKDKIMPGPTTFMALIGAYIQCEETEAILRMLKNPSAHGIPKQNRHFFEDAIEALESEQPNPLASLLVFDWARLQGVTSESPQELANITRSLRGL